jgi:hypothetical protein
MRPSTYRKKFPKSKKPDKSILGTRSLFTDPIDYTGILTIPSPLDNNLRTPLGNFDRTRARIFIEREMERVFDSLRYELYLLLIGSPLSRETERIVTSKIYQAMAPLQEDLIRIGLIRDSDVYVETGGGFFYNTDGRFTIRVNLRVRWVLGGEQDVFHIQVALS